MTQETQWDLFRTFEAVARLGTLTAAAKALGVSQSTVSRHLASLEEDAGSPLLLRQSPAKLTERGEALLAAIGPMVDAAVLARAALADRPELEGQVTVATVGEVVRWTLIRKLASFYRAYPRIGLRILADNRISSLAAGDADVSLRMTRPERGELFARKLSTVSFGFFVASSLGLSPTIPWLGLAGSLATIAEARHATRAFRPNVRPPRLLVEDVESLGLAVQSGTGVAILPRAFAARLGGVEEVSPNAVGAEDLGPIPDRELWMVVHRSKQRVPNVRAVMGWLSRVFESE